MARYLVQDDAEKCVQCIKQGLKYCQYGETAFKCCQLNDFTNHCQQNCSNQLVSNSFYSQYRICPQRELACGERQVNATFEEQYMTSQTGEYRGNITCVYHIENPWPDNPLYFNIYRLTNDSEIALYFREEHEDGTREFSTIIYEYPGRQTLFQGMTKEYIDEGYPFHNNTDMMKLYTFKHVKRLNVVAIGTSDHSQFDFGVSVSPLSIKAWDRLNFAADIAIWMVLITSFVYLVFSKLRKALRRRDGHEVFEDEIDQQEGVNDNQAKHE
ncbi:hypothetical protein FGO68_gene7019 [Halteria grandinella]|uniref:Uncharacterized protein n=1 Tax=Halteria grandinella TaxID=5974 RepID=A0A8J8NZR3_HALGN|nr:hypothetical protein FGO68_gene7019 [Halteria grandinella]